MGFPNAPNWQSGNPLDAWFSVASSSAPGAPRQICAGQGRGIIKALQRKLNSLGGLIGPALTIDGNWGANTQTALTQAVNRVANSATDATDRSYFREIETRLGADGRSRNISRESARIGVWVAYYLQNYDGTATRRAELVSLPDNTVLPRFGSSPDDDRGVNGGNLTCWDAAGPAPTPATREQVDTARTTGSTGVVPGGGGTTGTGTGTTTTTTTTTGGSGASSSGGKVLLWGAAAALVVYLASRKKGRRGGARRR